MTEKISILIPMYNASKTINKCLDSIINQTYKNIEIIIVNDSSTDNSLDIIKQYPNIKIYSNKKNMGLGYTRNILLKKCHTNYFMFVDSDDYLAPFALEKMTTKMSITKADIVMGRINNNYQTEIILNNKNKFNLIFNDIDKRYMIQQNKLYHKRIFKDLVYPNISFADDEFMIHKIINNSKKIVIIPDKTYFYTETGGLHNNYQSNYYLSIKAHQERYEFFKNTKYQRKANNMLKNIMIYYYKVFYYDKNKIEMQKIKKEFTKTIRKTKKYIRFRDIIFILVPSFYCLIRNNIGE